MKQTGQFNQKIRFIIQIQKRFSSKHPDKWEFSSQMYYHDVSTLNVRLIQFVSTASFLYKKSIFNLANRVAVRHRNIRSLSLLFVLRYYEILTDLVTNFFLKIAILLVFSVVRVTRSLVLCVCFIDRCLSFCTFSFGQCVVCPPIYESLLPPLVSSNYSLPTSGSETLSYVDPL